MKVFKATPYQNIHQTDDGHTIVHIDYFSYLTGKVSFSDYLKQGYSAGSLYARLTNPSYLQKLYITKDPEYMRYLNDFTDLCGDCDVIVMNPGVDLVHPEYLFRYFKDKLKVLHFIDDPHLSYSYGFCNAWAFDAATYISPSYSEFFSMEDILMAAGFSNNKWVPHSVSNVVPPLSIDDMLARIELRNNKALYVGGFYSGKADRLIYLRKNLTRDFDIFGRMPLNGYMLAIYSLFGRNKMFNKVYPLSDNERGQAYSRYSIGVNMHLSEPSLETGNARLYELPYNGLAQVVDSSKNSRVHEIFEVGEEILVYESIEECLELIKKLMNDRKLQKKIAINGFLRASTEYSYQNTLSDEFSWYEKLIKDASSI